MTPAPAPAGTIVATSGGFTSGRRTDLAVGPLLRHAVELSGAHGRRPRLVHLGTAGGDQRARSAAVVEAVTAAGFDVTVLNLFPLPSVDDPAGLLLDADVVWVGGGSVANLLAVWRVHDIGPAMRAAWTAGTVLAGVSAGSICWYVGGTTDSYGPELRAVTDGLALLPHGNGVHYDSEARRRPLVHRLVADGTLPTTHCTDDGVGLVYRGTELVEAVSEQRGKGAYVVHREGPDDAPRAVEQRLEPRLLPA